MPHEFGYPQADPPNPALIAEDDLVGVTVVLITCSYLGREFVRIGYYVNNEYTEPFEGEFPPRYVSPTMESVD
jgi:histone chaperone ASF1